MRKCPRCFKLVELRDLVRVSESGIYPIKRRCPLCGHVASTFIFQTAKRSGPKLHAVDEKVLATLEVGPATLREINEDIGGDHRTLHALSVRLTRLKAQKKINSDHRKPATYSLYRHSGGDGPSNVANRA
jgi:hypothetical protein